MIFRSSSGKSRRKSLTGSLPASVWKNFTDRIGSLMVISYLKRYVYASPLMTLFTYLLFTYILPSCEGLIQCSNMCSWKPLWSASGRDRLAPAACINKPTVPHRGFLSTKAETTFVFGYLGGGPLPFDPQSPGSTFIFALQSLPVILIVSALSSLLFYWRILPLVVKAFSQLLE